MNRESCIPLPSTYQSLLYSNALLVGVIACLFLLQGCAPVKQRPDIDRIVVFGDSNLDTGRLFKMLDNNMPGAQHWRGRVSNGPLVIEYLAKDIGAELESYAVGGATSGETNIVGSLFDGAGHVKNTGISKQIDEYIATDEALTSRDLIIIAAGSNDIFRLDRQDTKLLNQRIVQTVKNLQHAVDRLYALGAKDIVLFTRTVRAEIGISDDLNGVDLNLAIKKAFSQPVKQNDLNVRVFDAYTAIAEMMNNPEQYGFSEPVNALCVEVPSCASWRYDDGTELQDSYINWDAAHKTTEVHRLLAERLRIMVRSK